MSNEKRTSMIVYHKNLIRDDLIGMSNEDLIRDSKFSQAKPTRLLPALNKDYIFWMPNYGVGREDLNTVHDYRYVDSVFENDLTTANYALATVNAHWVAAGYAAMNGINTIAPVSGFHHAGYDYSWGFCVFNGLIYSAKRLLDLYPEIHIVIIDGDTHEGDGCLDIIKKLDIKRVLYFSEEKNYNEILKIIPKQSIIFYQAGVDGHVDDSFGGTMTDADYEAREIALLESGIPTVVNLAGGYTDHAMHLHLSTIERFTKWPDC